jgi:hypothetical protein
MGYWYPLVRLVMSCLYAARAHASALSAHLTAGLLVWLACCVPARPFSCLPCLAGEIALWAPTGWLACELAR